MGPDGFVALIHVCRARTASCGCGGAKLGAMAGSELAGFLEWMEW